MVNRTSEEVTEYLKQVSILESAIYKQEEMIKAANENLVKRHIDEPTLVTPRAKHIQLPVKQGLTENDITKLGTTVMICGALIALGIVLLTAGNGPHDEQWVIVTPFLISGFISLIVIVCKILNLVRVIKDNRETYESEMQDYLEEKEASAEAYQEQLVQNQKAYESALVSYQEQESLATKNYEKAQSEVQLLYKPLEDTKQLLAKLYEKDVIFSKYRNMIAICTMYEYFASGRCSELTGANGAYNMYEQELLQNRIINQLEQVNFNLEQVKQNQYILYQAISETNHALQEISSEVKGIVNAVTDIAISSRITAYCSQITAINAQAQTYIALIE